MGGNERLPMPYKNNLREFSIVGMAIALRKKKIKKSENNYIQRK
jgi:hypothetical protein